jgi:hypothetical protein
VVDYFNIINSKMIIIDSDIIGTNLSSIKVRPSPRSRSKGLFG